MDLFLMILFLLYQYKNQICFHLIELDLEYNQESDDNIEKFCDGNDDGELRDIDLEPKKINVKQKKERVISEEQKKFQLIDWLMLGH